MFVSKAADRRTVTYIFDAGQAIDELFQSIKPSKLGNFLHLGYTNLRPSDFLVEVQARWPVNGKQDLLKRLCKGQSQVCASS